jgi:hypothetical protein
MTDTIGNNPIAEDYLTASLTPGWEGRFLHGNIVVTVYPTHVQLKARGCDELAGPHDDGLPTPNAGALLGLTAAEARQVGGMLLEAAAAVEQARPPQ